MGSFNRSRQLVLAATTALTFLGAATPAFAFGPRLPLPHAIQLRSNFFRRFHRHHLSPEELEQQHLLAIEARDHDIGE